MGVVWGLYGGCMGVVWACSDPWPLPPFLVGWARAPCSLGNASPPAFDTSNDGNGLIDRPAAVHVQPAPVAPRIHAARQLVRLVPVQGKEPHERGLRDKVGLACRGQQQRVIHLPGGVPRLADSPNGDELARAELGVRKDDSHQVRVLEHGS